MSLPATNITLDRYRFTSWEGWIPDFQSVADIYTRPGDVSDGFQSPYSNGREVTAKAMAAFSNMADAKTFAAGIESLQSSNVQITDQWGDTFNVLVREVHAKPKACGGEAPYRVEADISLRIIDPSA